MNVDKWKLLERYRPQSPRDETLAEALLTLITAARAQWPLVRLDELKFIDHLKAKSSGPLEQVRGPELFLACACLHGDEAALGAFEQQFIARVDKAVEGVDPSPSFIDEVRQRVRERLLVGDAPKLNEYSGAGSLQAWTRTVALRLALNHKRDTAREVQDEGLMEALPMRGRDLELDYVRAQHREDFAAAFREALASLEGRSRNVLRLSYVDRLSIDQIGAMYGTHRATAARWLTAAREELMNQTRARLASKLKLTQSDLNSLLGALQSNLEISINRILRDE
jgi:RNA polymerase sigma-70 factor (ECF subfamily)